MKKEETKDKDQITVGQVIEEVTGEKEAKPIEEKIAEKKKQRPSASYTLRSFNENIKKLSELDLITNEEAKKMEEVYTSATTVWIKNGMK